MTKKIANSVVVVILLLAFLQSPAAYSASQSLKEKEVSAVAADRPGAPKPAVITDKQREAEQRQDNAADPAQPQPADAKAKAILWRGAMASNALRQLINEADWGELDYFVIDVPPGTSDIHLTLVQTLAITGAIVVTTPQQVALADARKGISMFMGEHVNVPVLGIVENMSWFTPAAHPDEQYFIFGRDGGKELAEKLGVELLGQIPLVAGICKGSDDGMPVVRMNDVSGVAFKKLATNVVEAIDRRNQTLPPTEVVQTH